MSRLREHVTAFHRAFGQPVLDTPQVPSDERVRLRARLIVEETLEFLEACFDTENDTRVALEEATDFLDNIIENARVEVVLPEAADALADIAYVLEGSNLEFGIDSGPVLEEVQRANMAKASGPKRADGKIQKPIGWTPPDIPAVLRAQGWRDVSNVGATPVSAAGLREVHGVIDRPTFLDKKASSDVDCSLRDGVDPLRSDATSLLPAVDAETNGEGCGCE